MRSDRRLPTRPVVRGWPCAVLVVALGCGDATAPSDPTATEGIATTAQGASTSTSTSSDDPTLDDDSTTAAAGSETTGGGDPEYPRPEPVAEVGDCPEGFLGPITYDGDGWLCLPPCIDGDPPTCPEPMSGDAEAACATAPFSSATPCTDDTDCTVDGEKCGNVGMGQMGCLLPPTHCLLRCDEGQTCPDEMSCSPSAGLCQYTPS